MKTKVLPRLTVIVALLFIMIDLMVSPCVSRASTQVIAWGDNSYHQTNVPAGLTDAVAISAGGGNSLSLKSNGSPVQWGEITNDPGWAVPAFLTDAVAISAGADPFDLALRADGHVIGWGGNDYGCSTIPPGLSSVVAIAAGYDFSLALKSDGGVVAWGDNLSGQTNVPPWLSNVVALAAGEFHSLGLRADGTVVGWGDNFHGEATGVSTPYSTNGVVTLSGHVLSNVVAIAAGNDYFSLALKSDGTVVGWGFNPLGETTTPPGLTNAVAIAAGSDFALALKSDGTVVPWGFSFSGATTVPSELTNVIAIAAGRDHGLALVSTGPPVLHGLLSNPSITSAGFSVGLPTQNGHVYALEYKNSLSDSTWSALPLVAGNGAIMVLSDPGAANQARFYRARRW